MTAFFAPGRAARNFGNMHKYKEFCRKYLCNLTINFFLKLLDN